MSTQHSVLRVFATIYAPIYSATPPHKYSMLRSVARKVKLTPVESEICGLVKDFCTHYNRDNLGQEPLVARITGGWVRDKLLGNSSNDLDIAINNMTGEQFAEKLTAYLQEHGLETHSLHKIDKNPSKSKHLETCTTKLFDIPVDFVNLRSEEYTSESRIPKMEFGTPYEDAMRRDATLNAMFYNIPEDKIEDFTERGLKDLENGVLRTPLSPRKTFLDDPLRILRLIRFASRFHFQIESETYEAMSDEQIHASFLHKISRERVYIELHKILESTDPFYALDLIQGASLSRVIFSTNEKSDEIDLVYEHLDEHLRLMVQKIPNIIKSHALMAELYPTVTEDFILSVVLSGFKNLRGPDPAKPKKSIPLAGVIAREGIKYPNTQSEIITSCVESQDSYNALVSNFKSLKRSEIGLELRKYQKHWKLVHIVNLALSYLKSNNDRIPSYDEFYQFVNDKKLNNVHDLKHLINGKELATLLGKKPGPWMTKVLDDVLVWQLDNPDKTKQDLIDGIGKILKLSTAST